MVRTILWVVRKLLAIVPCVLLAIWGYFYLKLCYYYLINPHRPVEIAYKAAAGIVHVHADSYLLDLESGRVYVRGLRVKGPKGGVVASAQLLAISNLNLYRGSVQNLVIDIYGISGRLVRLNNGQFQLAGLLPPTKNNNAEAPFQVNVHDADIQLVDQEGSPWEQRVQARGVKIYGSGSNWVAFGKANLPGMGLVSLRVQNASDLGLQIEGRTDSLDGTLAAKHFLTDPRLKLSAQYRKVDFSRAVASGPFQIFLPHNNRVSFHTEIAASAENVAFMKYRLDRLNFAGQIGVNGIQGKAQGAAGANRAELIGSANWKGTITAGTQFIVKSPDPSSLPSEVSRLIPKGVNFRNAVAQGWVSYRSDKSILGQADFIFDRILYRSETASNVKGALFADSGRVRLDLQHVDVAGTSPSGSAWFDLKNKTVIAYSQGDHLQLEDIGRLTHTPGLSGLGSAKAIITGPLSKPAIQFQVSGSASYRRSKYRFGPDRVQVAGSFKNNTLDIRRGYLDGVDGLFAVSGSSSSSGQALDLDVEARNVHPRRYVPDLGGVTSLSARVTGTYRNPVARGLLRGEDLRYQKQQVPAAIARFLVDRSHVDATSIRAISGTMDLDGSASYLFNSRKLKGNFSLDGVELAQFLGDKAAGILNAPTIQLNGTLSKPTVVVRVEGSNLIFGDILIENLEALATGTPQSVLVDHATASLLGGTVSANGSYDIGARSGNLVAASTPLDLEKLAPFLGEQVSVKGSVSLAEAKLAYKDNAISGSANGKLERVIANGAPVGDGNWSALSNGNDISGELSIGELIPELRVIDATAKYNLKDKTLEGSFDADHARARDLIAASLRYLPSLTPADTDALLSATGDLTVGATFRGPINSPDVSLATLALSHITYKNRGFGELLASKIERNSGIWSVPNLSLTGPEGIVTVTGKVDEKGPITLAATGKGISAHAFSPFVPSLDSSTAMADFTANASGQTKSPDILGTMNLTHVFKAPPSKKNPGKDEDMAIDISKASFANGAVGLEGTYRYDGFTGTIFGSAPYKYVNGLAGGSVQGHLVLDRRDLKDIPLFDEVADPTRSSGTVSGDISVSGPVDQLILSGGITLTAGSLGLRFSNSDAYVKKIDDDFKNVSIYLSITKDKKLAFAGSADEVRGGSVYLNLSSPLPDFSAILKNNSQNLGSSVMNSRLTGVFGTKNLVFRQSAPGGYVAGSINGEAPIGGTLAKPAIGTRELAGKFTLSKVDTTLPTFPAGAGGSVTPSIDPSFNLAAVLADAAHVKSATADLYMTGNASLKGDLDSPIAAGDLVVARGTIRLPGGTVRLSQGGTVDFGYRHTFAEDTTASLNVDLEGHTSITAIRYGQNTQRYDITLDITGDLLQDNGLHFDAISDPPDLSSDDVLALLGEKSLLESLGSTDQNEAERRVRDALVGYALPSLLDPYTSSLAQKIGLDYVSLEYNSVDLATIQAARALSSDFTLQYRQQVGMPPPGYRAIYDFRIIYSPRRGPSLLRRLDLSAGFDQDRPWKVALEYGTRFGGYSGPSLRNKTVISSPAKP